MHTPFIILFLFISTVEYMVEVYSPETSADNLFLSLSIRFYGEEQQTKIQLLSTQTEEMQGYDMYELQFSRAQGPGGGDLRCKTDGDYRFAFLCIQFLYGMVELMTTVVEKWLVRWTPD